jgi:tRNA dimethylallyltransferase
MNNNIITILGSTATGKTRLAAKAAYHFNGEIISADSRQVYRGMDIGTGKDYEDYDIEGTRIPGHLIDLAEPSEEFNLYLYKELFCKTYDQITERAKTPILCGGTGMYLSAILQNYKLNPKDADLATYLNKLSFAELQSLFLKLNKAPHNKTDLTERERTITALTVLMSENEYFADTSEIRSFTIGINPGREIIKKNITDRLKKRLETGMIEEVKSLLERGISHERMLLFGLEYKFIAQYLKGELNYNDMFQKLNSAIHSFAKRQMTWFRKMEKEGIQIHWFESTDFNNIKKAIESVGFRSN